MNQRIAKEIKKQVYGDYEPNFTRKYFKIGGDTIHRDKLRKRYQQAKRDYMRGAAIKGIIKGE